MFSALSSVLVFCMCVCVTKYGPPTHNLKHLKMVKNWKHRNNKTTDNLLSFVLVEGG